MSNSILFDVFQYGIRTFTFAQIKWRNFIANYYSPFLNQLNKKLTLFFGEQTEDDESKKKNSRYPTLNVIKDGMSYLDLPIDYIKYADLFVTSFQDKEKSTCQNIVAIPNPENKVCDIFNTYLMNKKPCNFKFLSVEISINDLKFPIHLYKSDEYNYFIEGNVIDRKFLNYFIKEHKLLNDYVKVFEDDYNFLWVKEGDYDLEIIDQDCNVVNIGGNQKITLLEETYNIS